MPKLSIIIPCYYNELNIPVTAKELLANESIFPEDVSFEYVMVDDGSKDNTLAELKTFSNENPGKVKIIKLSGNFGSYNAIQAGMKYATGDCNVVIAADLQDPPEIMGKMYDYWLKGIKLVLANRIKRADPFWSKLFAKWYHHIIRKYALTSMPAGGFDFCLFDKKLKDEIIRMDEKNTNALFLLFSLKYDFVSIPYERRERRIGESKWTVSKKIKLLIDSFVSFSFFPIRLISVIGLLLGFSAMIYTVIILISKYTGHIPIQGWTSLMIVFLFISAFQMIALGILGEYVWRTLDASRKRPNYIVEDVI